MPKSPDTSRALKAADLPDCVASQSAGAAAIRRATSLVPGIPRCSISAHMPRRDSDDVSAPVTQLSCPLLACLIISRRVIALTSWATCPCLLLIARLYPSQANTLECLEPDMFKFITISRATRSDELTIESPPC